MQTTHHRTLVALDLPAWMSVLAPTGDAPCWEPKRLRLFSAVGRRRCLRFARH
ncbi:hypothetical protein [Streptomyces sp. NPDC001307]|uniref:hypothetical protein n=1 Tax=Streptomyces sp. NPDC001307 TaxID=3364560 RepID=UPI0036B32B20